MLYKRKTSYFVAGLLVLALVVSATTLFAAPVTPQDLPDRPPEATAVPDAVIKSSPAGAKIMLQLDPEAYRNWTQMEWQDPYTETWHPVDGWRGHVDQTGQVVWWISGNDLGKGPFRWLVYESEEAKQLVTQSDAFYLPEQNNQLLEITIGD